MSKDASDSEEPPDVPIHCPVCGTSGTVALPDVAERVERHNDRLHDGEERAEVDPELADQLADLVAEDMGLL